MDDPDDLLTPEVLEKSLEILLVGKARDKLENLERVMQQNFTDHDDLDDILTEKLSENQGKKGLEAGAQSVLEFLSNDPQAAIDYMRCRMLRNTVTGLTDSMKYLARAKDWPEDTKVGLNAEFATAKEQTKNALAEFSEGSKLVCNIAVDAYVSTIGQHLGLPNFGIDLH